MRRFLEVALVAVTAVVLVATGATPQQCASETTTYRADTTCGPVANVQVSIASNCAMTTTGAELAALPTVAEVGSGGTDAGLLSGFRLSGDVNGDGGYTWCDAKPVDDGGTHLDIICHPRCGTQTFPDGGVFRNEICPTDCGGTLTPQ